MSANRSTTATDAADDLWLVRLRTGKVRAMTLDELDAAFDAGLINALTPILPPSAKEWTRLGVVAGLDEHAHGTTLVGHSETVIMPSSRPRALQHLMAPIPVAPMTPARPAAVAVAPAKAPVVTRRKAPAPKTITGRMFAALALAVLVSSFGISYAARVALGGTTTEAPTESVDAPAVAPAKQASAVSPPSSPAAVAAEENGPKAAPHHVDAEGVSGRDAQIRKEGPARARRHVVRHATGRTPFLNGGDKYDPLNAKL